MKSAVFKDSPEALLKRLRRSEKNSRIGFWLFLVLGTLSIAFSYFERFRLANFWQDLAPSLADPYLPAYVAMLVGFEARRQVALYVGVLFFLLAGFARFGLTERRLLIKLAEQQFGAELE